MKITVQHSTAREIGTELPAMLERTREALGAEPNFLVVTGTPQHRELIAQELCHLAPGVALHGSTTCRGILTERGHHSESGHAFGLLAISDPLGAYGSAAEDLGDDATRATREALQRALLDADRPGEVPELVWLTAAPGCEEEVLSEIQRQLGDAVPVLGGSAADNDVVGEWGVFASAPGLHQNGVAISVLFPSTPISTAFHSGYEPTDQGWEVTAAEGRVVRELDSRPAAEVYNEATGGLVEQLERAPDTTLLQLSTFQPLGRVDSYIGEIPMYLLSHPAQANDDGSIALFSEVGVGDQLTLMEASEHSLLSRPARVMQSALDYAAWSADEVAGALLIFCGGCMLAVEDEIEQVAEGVRGALPGVPFLGTFTFGEQGRFLGSTNRHGNLMISCVLFRKS